MVWFRVLVVVRRLLMVLYVKFVMLFSVFVMVSVWLSLL